MASWRVYTVTESGDEEYVETVVTEDIEEYLEENCSLDVFDYMFEDKSTILIYEIDWTTDKHDGIGSPEWRLYNVN